MLTGSNLDRLTTRSADFEFVRNFKLTGAHQTLEGRPRPPESLSVRPMTRTPPMQGDRPLEQLALMVGYWPVPPLGQSHVGR
jgi:hypothetical protein